MSEDLQKMGKFDFVGTLMGWFNCTPNVFGHTTHERHKTFGQCQTDSIFLTIFWVKNNFCFQN